MRQPQLTAASDRLSLRLSTWNGVMADSNSHTAGNWDIEMVKMTMQIEENQDNRKALASLAVLSSALLHFSALVVSPWTGVFSAGLIGVGTILRTWKLLPLLLLTFLMCAAPYYFPPVLWQFPSVPFLIPFLSTIAIVLFIPSARRELLWFRAGHPDPLSVFLILLTGFCATGALILWAVWTDNIGSAAEMVKGVAAFPPWMILFVLIPAFAVINAFAEEVVYRGVLQSALARVFGEKHFITHAVQASAFAAVHIRGGFPNGQMGYLMVLIYGLMLGILKTRTRGMLAPYLTHILADLTIAGILYLKFPPS